jgi:hypothetical protein
MNGLAGPVRKWSIPPQKLNLQPMLSIVAKTAPTLSNYLNHGIQYFGLPLVFLQA